MLSAREYVRKIERRRPEAKGYEGLPYVYVVIDKEVLKRSGVVGTVVVCFDNVLWNVAMKMDDILYLHKKGKIQIKNIGDTYGVLNMQFTDVETGEDTEVNITQIGSNRKFEESDATVMIDICRDKLEFIEDRY